jgi:hypothetical protein
LQLDNLIHTLLLSKGVHDTSFVGVQVRIFNSSFLNAHFDSSFQYVLSCKAAHMFLIHVVDLRRNWQDGRCDPVEITNRDAAGSGNLDSYPHELGMPHLNPCKFGGVPACQGTFKLCSGSNSPNRKADSVNPLPIPVRASPVTVE